MHTDYHHSIIRQFRDEQLRRASHQQRIEGANQAEKLLAELDPGRTYTCGYLCSRIAKGSARPCPDARLTGRDADHDLRLFIEDMFDSANVPVEAVGQRVITAEELAKRLNVSTKTISRWRRYGLVSRRFVFDGRKRVGFLESSVEQFVTRNQDRVRRGSQFSQLTDQEREWIFARARRLAQAGGCPAEVYKRLARHTGRSVETIRYTLKHHDREHPESAIFPEHHTLLSEENRRKIYQFHRRGESIESLAKRFCLSKAALQRIVAQARAERIRQLPLDYIPNEGFRDDLTPDQERAICGPMPASDQPARRARRPSGLPPYLASLYEVPLLAREQEMHLFRKMNYLKHKAGRLLERLDPDRPQASLMDQIEKLFDQAVATKNEIIRANLRLVVSIAKRYVGGGGSFFELVSDGNMSLLQAVEKFDFARGNKFSTYATWALVKNFSRSIPTEHLYHQRFRSQPLELFASTEDVRADHHEQEARQSQRERQVQRLLGCLDEREQEIVMRRFGLAQGQEPLKLKEIGALMGVTKERVRQLETRAMEKLRRAAHEGQLELAAVE